MSAEPIDAPDTMAHIERTLHERIGLDASTVGSSLVHRAVNRRMQACGILGVREYAARLAADDAEMQELVEEVVIPETYFFREPEALDAVARRASLLVPRASADAPVRVLSAPCSTGEEPYSIAMTMVAAGVPFEGIAVDALDVSENAVRRARAAVYRGGSFRGDMQPWRRYFAESKQGFALTDDIKSLVRIVRGNLLDPAFRTPRSTYDYIFCRNLLIYFDGDTQTRVLATLTGLLSRDGILVVGAADTFAVRRAGYVPVPGAERSFLFHYHPAAAVDIIATTPVVREKKVAPRAKPAAPKRDEQVPRSLRTSRDDNAKLPTRRDDKSTQPTHLIDEIARLADAGRLADAIKLGESTMNGRDASADLLALMGTTYDAMGDGGRAEACYRRALYLDPSHADALLHLALLMESRGDAASATRLRARARRTLDSTGGAS
ncbi:MAG: CheR family methyltransferase [bacterium]